MSNKETRTISFDAEADEFLGEQDNASALVNDLVQEYRKGADRHSVAFDLLIEQKSEAAKEARDRADRLERELQELKQMRAETQAEEAVEYKEAIQKVQAIPEEDRTVTNDGVQHLADQLGVSATDLLDAANNNGR